MVSDYIMKRALPRLFPACRIGGIGGPRMSVTVKTFARLADAAGALSSERGARFLAGEHAGHARGPEADPMIETIVRSTDPNVSHISASSGRVELGVGVTMAASSAERELAFLHPVARAVGGPAVREAATVGGNLFAPSPYGRFRGSAARPRCDGRVRLRLRPARSAAEEFLRSRDRGATSVARRHVQAAGGRRALPVRESHPRSSQGHLGAFDRCPAAARQRQAQRREDRL